jgi:hypothetical protein
VTVAEALGGAHQHLLAGGPRSPACGYKEAAEPGALPSCGGRVWWFLGGTQHGLPEEPWRHWTHLLTLNPEQMSMELSEDWEGVRVAGTPIPAMLSPAWNTWTHRSVCTVLGGSCSHPGLVHWHRGRVTPEATCHLGFMVTWGSQTNHSPSAR